MRQLRELDRQYGWWDNRTAEAVLGWCQQLRRRRRIRYAIDVWYDEGYDWRANWEDPVVVPHEIYPALTAPTEAITPMDSQDQVPVAHPIPVANRNQRRTTGSLRTQAAPARVLPGQGPNFPVRGG